MPAGTPLEVSAVYDNSAGNAANPNNPPLHARFGEQTTDEMCVVLLMLIPEWRRLSEARLEQEGTKIPCGLKPAVRSLILTTWAELKAFSFL